MIRASASRCGLATAAVIAAVAAVPAPALGASGATALALNGAAAQALRDGGVQIAALKPARKRGKRVTLPVRSGLVGSSTTLIAHRGGIAMRARGEALRLTKLRLLLGKRSRVTASLDGGAGITLFRIPRGGKRDVDAGAGAVALRRLRLKLTAGAARAIAGRFDLSLGKTRAFGTLSSRIAGLLAGGDETTGKTPAEEAVAAGCAAPSGAGPTPEEPLPVATRPGGAVDVLGATIDWHVRESFIRYIATGEGTSVSAGATADPPVLLPGSSSPLTYDFHFPFVSGWHDGGANAANPADDRAAVYFGGAVRFLYSGHEIDLATSSPEIEISGSSSRAIFAVAEDGGAGTRQVLVNLDLGRAAAIESSGNTHTYRGVPGAIPAGTAGSVFAGFYAPGTEFGCFNVSYTTA